MSAYNSYPSSYSGRQYGYGAHSTISQPYYSYAPSYAPSTAYTNYSNVGYSSGGYNTGAVSERTYFSLNGKLVRSYKIRNYRVRVFYGHRVAIISIIG
jgi:hypothetical protein